LSELGRIDIDQPHDGLAVDYSRKACEQDKVGRGDAASGLERGCDSEQSHDH
jgi:hypothetical protein